MQHEEHGSGHGRLDDFVLDLDRHEMRWQGQPLPLAPQDFSLLSLLARQPIRAWSFQELLTTVWHDEFHRDTSCVRMAVGRLRRRLEQGHVPVRIRSVYGYGFILAAEADTPTAYVDRVPPLETARDTGRTHFTSRIDPNGPTIVCSLSLPPIRHPKTQGVTGLFQPRS